MLTREQRRQKLSEYGRKGADAKWGRLRETIPQPNYHELPDPCVTIEVTNHMSGKVTTLVFHPGDRRGRFRVDENGQFWTVCGWSKAMERIRKRCKRTPLYIEM